MRDYIEYGNGEFYILKDDKKYFVPVQRFHKFWKNPEKGNTPDTYAVDDQRSEILVNLFNLYCSKDDSILELGCNIGRNLHHLYKSGFTKLSGLDIYESALEEGSRIYPDTVAKVKRATTSIEDFVLDGQFLEFDVVFSMAVLMHLHPSSEWVFPYIARLAKKYIITVEDEEKASYRAVPRNYKSIFEKHHFKEIFQERVVFQNKVDDTGEVTLTYRVFKNET